MGTVLVLPGLYQAADAWAKLAVGHRQLVVVNYQDLAGLAGAGDFANLVRVAVERIHNLPQPVTVIGFGFGATLALGMAAQHPGRMERMILVNPRYRYGGRLFSWLQGRPTTIAGPEARQLEHSLRHLDLTNRLMKVQTRTRVLVGEVAHQEATALANRLVDGRLVIVPGLGKQLGTVGLQAVAQELA